MRIRALTVIVVISMCLPAPALAATWTGSSGLLWSNGDNWDPVGVPDGVDAIINNGLLPTPTLNSVSSITNLQVTGFSTLNIDDGAGLTVAGSGTIAGGGLDGYVYQTGGAVSVGSNLTLANNTGDFAQWAMTSDGSLAVANDLIVGTSGGAEFELRDTSSLTVGGRIDVGQAGGGGGTMTIGGGTLGQLAGGGDPAILADLTVSGVGTLAVEGNSSTINVADYTQASTGALHVRLDGAGIATINVNGDMTLGGELNVSLAGGGVAAPGIYDILVATNNTITGEFTTYTMDQSVYEVRYQQNDDGKDVVRLYVNTEAPELPILGNLPGGRYSKIVSMNVKGASDYDVADGAGVVAADNWNNLVYASDSGTVIYDNTQLVDDSGAPAVSMALTQNSSVPISSHNQWGWEDPICENATVLGSPSDPNVNMYGSQAPAMGWCAEHLPPFSHIISAADTELTGLNAEFPDGYDLIVNVAKWPEGTSGGSSEYVEVRRDAGAVQIGNLQMDLQPLAYRQDTGFVEGENYVILKDLRWDTLDLNLNPLAPTTYGQAQSMQITGVQLLGLFPSSKEVIVDNLDISLIEKSTSFVWYERGTADEWDGSSYYAQNQGNWFRWNTPVMPFAEVTEYEVFVWYSTERQGGGYFNSDSAAEYIVHHAGGSETFIIDQDENPGQWVSLGFFPFSGESAAEYVQLTRTIADGSDGVTSGDAVRWLWTRPIPEPGGLGLIGLALLVVRKRHL